MDKGQFSAVWIEYAHSASQVQIKSWDARFLLKEEQK